MQSVRAVFLGFIVVAAAWSPSASYAWMISEPVSTDPTYETANKLGVELLTEIQQFFSRLVVAEQTGAAVEAPDPASLQDLAQRLIKFAKAPQNDVFLKPTSSILDLVEQDSRFLGFKLPETRASAYLLVADRINLLAAQLGGLQQFGPVNSTNPAQRRAFNQIIVSIAKILLVGSDMAALIQSG